jgi:hypothetical protein
MKTTLSAIALAATLAQPAAAITFPSLTTIYVGSGVTDDGGGENTGTASSFFCSNVSGLTAQIRVLILNAGGTAIASSPVVPLSHGNSTVFSTHATILGEVLIATANLSTGTVNIESTQSGVFCRGAIVNAAGPRQDSSPIALVRVNPHPGTVE